MVILGISGSLRKGSFNTALIREAVAQTPEGVTVVDYGSLGDIPPFNQDNENTPPDSVVRLKTAVVASDAILFAIPEYNYSIPGVLKNAIDWASRPYGKNSWEGKPVGVMSASSGMLGGARAQYQLRQVFVFLDMHPVNKPEVIVTNAAGKISPEGIVTDGHTKDKIREMVASLASWTAQLHPQVTGGADEAEAYTSAYKRCGEVFAEPASRR